MKNFFKFIEPAYHLESNDWLESHSVILVRYRIEKNFHLFRKNKKKLIHYLFSKENLQIGKQINALVDYVKRIYNISILFICTFAFP